MRNAILGVSWFWFIGTVLTGNLPVYAETHLGGTQTLYVFALAVFSIGVGVGSLLCEKLSARTVEIGLVPLGAIGMSACILHLAFAPAIAAQGLDVQGFMAQPGAWRVVLDLAGIGLFAGFYVVPLFALIQSRTPRAELSRVIAGMNIQNAVFIVLAALGGVALQQALGWSIPQLLLALGLSSIVVAAWIFSIVPEFLMRFLSWLLVRSLYRLKLHGIERHVPDEGLELALAGDREAAQGGDEQEVAAGVVRGELAEQRGVVAGQRGVLVAMGQQLRTVQPRHVGQVIRGLLQG